MRYENYIILIFLEVENADNDIPRTLVCPGKACNCSQTYDVNILCSETAVMAVQGQHYQDGQVSKKS